MLDPRLRLTLVTDGLQRLFARSSPPVAWLRGAGLNATDRCPALKRWLCSRAMGVAGDVPLLAAPYRRGLAAAGRT